MEDEVTSQECSACCTGCRFLSIIGLSSDNGGDNSKVSHDACYQSCDESYKADTIKACHLGCDNELEVAKTKLVELNNDPFFQQFDPVSMLNGFFGNLFGPSNSQDAVEAKPAKVDNSNSAKKDEKNDDAKFLDDLLKSLMTESYSDDVAKDHANKNSNGPLELRGAESEPKEEPNKSLAYLKNIWKDRNTVQVLLIASITACLLAIVWMLCNTSTDPIVRRYVVETNLPPPYDVLCNEADDKKSPILVVAEAEDAGPLPIKEKPLEKSDI
jgi:hypothetical protein